MPVSMAAPGSPWAFPDSGAAYRAACGGACHIAFPPGLLIADDWLAIMSDLERHFGANAALDPRHRQEIGDFLQKNGATDRKYASPEEDMPRITTLPWFAERHQDARRVVMKGRVKSVADCAACHKGSEIDRITGSK